MVMAVFLAIFLAPSILFPITLDPRDFGLLPYGYGENTETETTKEEVVEENTNTKGNTLVYILIVIYAIFTNIVVSLPQHLPSYATSLQYPESLGAMMLSMCLIGNISSKLALGALSDKLGGKTAILLIEVINALSIVLLILHMNQLFMYGGSVLLGFGYSTAAVGLPLLIKDLFGNQRFGKIYPVISFIGTAMNALASSFVGVIYDMTGGYYVALIIILVLIICVIGCVIGAYYKNNAVEA